MAAGAAGAGMTAGTTNNNNNNNNNNNKKKRVRHNTHYITGLGDGNVNAYAHDLSRSGGDHLAAAAAASPKKGNTRSRQQQQQHQNHANNGLVGAVGGAIVGRPQQQQQHQLDDMFDEELFRKKMNQDHPHHNVRGNFDHGTGGNQHIVQQQAANNANKDYYYGRKDHSASRGVGDNKASSGWDFFLFSDATAGGAGPDEYNIGTAATPWQMSAFALLGAVILLSALFLHVLADAHSDQQHNYHQQQHSSNGHSYRRRRNGANHRSNNNHHSSTSTKVTKRKKTDEWSDDAEDELLSLSLRGYRAESDDDVAVATHSSSTHHQHHHHVAPQASAALYYPYQQQQPKLQHRKNTTSGGLGVAGVVSNSGVVSALAPGLGASSSTCATAAGTATVNTPTVIVAPFQHRNYYINPSGGAVVATIMSNRANNTSTTATAATVNSSRGGSSHSSSYQVNNVNNNTRTPLALNRPTVSVAGVSPAADSSSTLHVPGMMPPPPPLPGMYLTPSLQQQATFAMLRSSPYDGTGTSRHNLNARVLSGVSSFGSLMDPDNSGCLDDVEAESKIYMNKNENIKTPSKLSVTIQVPPSAAAAPPQEQARAVPRAYDMENDCDVLRNHVFHSSPDEISRETIKLADLIVDKTPRARNGRLTIMPGDKPSKDDDENTQDDNKAAVTAVGVVTTQLMPTKISAAAATTTTAAATTTPKTPVAQRAMIHQDSPSPTGTPIMPFLPNLDPVHISKPPRSINVDDLHLFMMMESGNVTWCRQQQESCILMSTSEDSGILATEPTPHHGNKHNKMEQPLPSHMAMMLQPSISECCPSSGYDDDASLDDNDPRKNIRHKRGNLTLSTDSAQSLQGDVNFSELHMQEVIGGGGFGQVWRAVWLGTPVAVKVLTGSAQSKNVPRAVLEEFAAEINLLRGMRHPNICLYMGACLQPPNRAIITELAANGSLWDALRLPLCPPYSCCDGISSREAWPLVLYRPDPRHGTPPAALSSRLSPPVPPRGSWPWILVKRVACGAARGMAYLHSGSPPVLHRDLKSANILLDESYTAKVCDFGLSRLKSQDRSMTGNCGTVQWMAPEVLANQSYNEKADVFSYGIICWELLTRQCPYEGMSAIQCAMAVLNRDQRPEIPRWCPPPLHALIRRCVKKDPKERPTFTQILDALDKMP